MTLPRLVWAAPLYQALQSRFSKVPTLRPRDDNHFKSPEDFLTSQAGRLRKASSLNHLKLSAPVRCHSPEEERPVVPEVAGDASSADQGALFAERMTDADLAIFSGTSHPQLARDICSHLGVALGRARIDRFADGEIFLQILDEVRARDVYVVQSSPAASLNVAPETSLMELFFFIATLKRASAKRVTAVLPYLGYFRQTSAFDASRPISAADVGRILVAMGVDRVIFVDVHARRVEGFFPKSIPLTNLHPQSLAIEYFRRKKEVGASITVVSTDNTGTEKAEAFMSRMNRAGFDTSMATIINNRTERPRKAHVRIDPPVKKDSPPSGPERRHQDVKTRAKPLIVGEVQGRDCIIVDDIIDTGERVVNSACALKEAGAKRIYVYATHGLFSRGAIDRIIRSPIKEVVTTDTIRLPENLYCEKLHIISVSLLLAEAIRRIHLQLPLSHLHRDLAFDQKTIAHFYEK